MKLTALLKESGVQDGYAEVEFVTDGPCDHTETVCTSCVKTWLVDWWLWYEKPGVDSRAAALDVYKFCHCLVCGSVSVATPRIICIACEERLP